MRCSSADVRKGQNCVLHANAIAATHSTHQLVLQLKCCRRRLAHARQENQEAWTVQGWNVLIPHRVHTELLVPFAKKPASQTSLCVTSQKGFCTLDLHCCRL